MLIIGCDFHTRYQQIAMAREETGELLLERRLDHDDFEGRLRGTDGTFSDFLGKPQKPFNRPNSRSTLIFDHSLQNT